MSRSSRSNSGSSGGFLFKTGLFALLAGLAYWIFDKSSGNKSPRPDESERPARTEQPAEAPQRPTSATVPDQILPGAGNNEVVRHTYFTLAYNEEHEQAEWVAFELTRERLNSNWAERPNSFRPDPDVRTESATPRDYSGSGYDKGHLCAAADMAFNELAIDETFLMSNISPQVRTFNMGVWRELEESTRDWARKFKHLYVVTGPVLTEKPLDQIGFSKVSVPAAYYKVLLAPEAGRAIAFILPNEPSDRPIMDYACTIDQVEETTGIDFFPQVLKGLDEELEGSLDKDAWPIDRQRYQRRVQEWNRR